MARCALDAIADAKIRPEDVDCVHLHGTGTPKNEPAEAAAMRRIFGSRASEVPVFSLKGQVGHLVGACGAVETLAAALCLREQVVLPTVNCMRVDQSLGLRVVQGEPLAMPLRHILKLNAAFGGQNAALVRGGFRDGSIHRGGHRREFRDRARHRGAVLPGRASAAPAGQSQRCRHSSRSRIAPGSSVAICGIARNWTDFVETSRGAHRGPRGLGGGNRSAVGAFRRGRGRMLSVNVRAWVKLCRVAVRP
ncbi:MAG: hypothetical protein IPN71_14110 [Fibrobacteres bacterium]|nr:hypothetical protein [Fibrobacterota bacterium]